MVSAFVNSGYFDLVADVVDGGDVTRLLDTRRRARRAGDSGTVRRRRGVRPADRAVQVLINGDNANTATTVMGYAVGIVSAVSARYEVQARLGSPGGTAR